MCYLKINVSKTIVNAMSAVNTMYVRCSNFLLEAKQKIRKYYQNIYSSTIMLLCFCTVMLIPAYSIIMIYLFPVYICLCQLYVCNYGYTCVWASGHLTQETNYMMQKSITITNVLANCKKCK